MKIRNKGFNPILNSILFIRNSYYQTVGTLLALPFALAGKEKPLRAFHKIITFLESIIFVYAFLFFVVMIINEYAFFACIPSSGSSDYDIKAGQVNICTPVHESTVIQYNDIIACGLTSSTKYFDENELENFNLFEGFGYPHIFVNQYMIVLGLPGDKVDILNGVVSVNEMIVLNNIAGLNEGCYQLSESQYLAIFLSDDQENHLSIIDKGDIDGRLLFHKGNL